MENIVVTRPGETFLRNQYEVIAYDYKVRQLIAESDATKSIPADNWRGPAREAMEAYFQMQSEMYYCRLIDNYLSYLSDLIAQFYRLRPEALQTDDTFTFSAILQHQTMDDLISAMAEKRVFRLSMQSLETLSKDFEKMLGLKLYKDESERAHITELIEIRNVVVHNRGIVNGRFLARVREKNLLGDEMYHSVKVGDPVGAGMDTLIYAVAILENSIMTIDPKASQKLQLPQHEFDLASLRSLVLDSPLMQYVRDGLSYERTEPYPVP